MEEEDKYEDVGNETGGLADIPSSFSPEQTESPTQVSDGFSLSAAGGRATSRYTSFGLSDEPTEGDPRQVESHPPFADDHEDDVLNDILSMAADPRAISPPRQMDRLTSRFANQSLAPDPYGAFGAFDSEPIRRDSSTMSQFFPDHHHLQAKILIQNQDYSNILSFLNNQHYHHLLHKQLV